MRRLIFLILVLLAVPLLYARAATNSAASAIYLIAATPLPRGPGSFPAALYTIGENGKLLLIRQLFTADQYFRDIGDDLHGKMYVAGQYGVFIIHQDDPAREDFVPYEHFDDFPCWGVVRGGQVGSAMQYCIADQLIKILGDAEPGKPRVGPGDWAAFESLRYGGENGGPLQINPPLAAIAGVNLVMPYSFQPEVVLAQLPPEFNAKPELRRLVWVLGSTDRYLALWILPAYMVGGSVDASRPRHAGPLQVLVLYRPTNHWRRLELPTTVTSLTRAPVRIFGDWLVTTVMEWSPGPHKTEGTVLEHGRPSQNELPAVHSYDNEFVDLHLPGKLVLQNLTDDRKLSLNTDQEDSEIVAIRADGQMLYRVNDSIYSAKIAGNQFTAPTLLVKSDDVLQIHWAFWGPPTKNQRTAGSSRESN